MTPERWQQVERVYYAALAADIGARPAVLEEACAGDEELRREVVALLERESEAEHFLSEPALDVVARERAGHARTLTSGTHIGVYRILAPLGAGGMGEVYRAHDTRLGRDVALKVLPEFLLSDAGRHQRLEREARLLAALNHPHIGAIYGLEDANGSQVLVLELVDGDSLDQRLVAGPLPVARAMAFARQIADALEAAHEKGIIHRDLKPANIMVTADDQVKVLDFGLASAADVNAASNAATSPTLTVGATQGGVLLGTAAYMAPEQAQGRLADKRSDVWAFGCVLFEMLCGRAPFGGATVSETLASVLRDDPDWSLLPAWMPPGLDALLKGCLEKNSRERIADISTVLFVLKHEPTAPSRAPRAVSAPLLNRRWVLAAIVAASAAAGVAASVALWPHPTATDLKVVRFRLAFTEAQPLTLSRRAIAVSPDGSHIAYSAGGRIFVRSVADADGRPVAGADPGIFPVFSPDGQFLVFWADGALKQISIAGGVPITVCATAAPFGLDWHTSGIVFTRPGTGIMRVSSNGSTPQAIVPLTEKDGAAMSVQLLPDGDTVLFSLARSEEARYSNVWQESDVFVGSIKTGERKRIIEGGSDAYYVATGHLVYTQEGTLMLVGFDVQRKQVTGSPVPVVEGVRRSGGAQFAVSDAGALAYIPGRGQGAQDNVFLYDRKGTVTPLQLPRGSYRNPRVSPNGKWLAIETNDDSHDSISIYELSGASSIRPLTIGGNNRVPVWSADSARVAFQSDRDGDRGIFWQAISGGPPEPLTRAEPGTHHNPESWSPNNSVLLFSITKGIETTLWTLSIRDRKIARFDDVTSIRRPTNAVFRPDGRWVAYQTGESDSAEAIVYVQPFPPTGAPIQIARGSRPMWSPDGAELFFVPAPSQFMAVSVRTQPTFRFTAAVKVPRRFGLTAPASPRPYDILPDGRFLAVDAASGSVDQGLPEIQVVLNWFEELKNLVAPSSSRGALSNR